MIEATCATAAIDDDRLRAALAFGDERTMEQDPVFAFRILVDGAIRMPTHAGRGNNDLLRGADSRPGIVLREVRWVQRNPGRVVGALFAIR